MVVAVNRTSGSAGGRPWQRRRRAAVALLLYSGKRPGGERYKVGEDDNRSQVEPNGNGTAEWRGSAVARECCAGVRQRLSGGR